MSDFGKEPTTVDGIHWHSKMEEALADAAELKAERDTWHDLSDNWEKSAKTLKKLAGKFHTDIAQLQTELTEYRSAVAALQAEVADVQTNSKAYWRRLARKNQALLRGAHLALAGLVHDLGGKATVGEETLKNMSQNPHKLDTRFDDKTKAVHIHVYPAPMNPQPPSEEILGLPESNQT